MTLNICTQNDVKQLYEGKLKNIRRIHFEQGTYYFDKPVRFRRVRGLKISGNACLTGAVPLSLEFQPFRDKIVMAKLPRKMKIDAVWADGMEYHMARYPKADPSEDGLKQFCAIGPEKIKTWKTLEYGYLHALHSHFWGGYHYRIIGKTAENTLKLEGGWQNNRDFGYHPDYMAAENILEELTEEGEFFCDGRRLYLIPYRGAILSKLEAVINPCVFQFRDCSDLSIEGLTFTKTARTFMETREPLLRSDWRICRNGSVLFENSADCKIHRCRFCRVGSNAVFVSGNNQNITVSGCEINQCDANGICFVGKADCVRSPLFHYDERQNKSDVDMETGPKSENYPKNCTVSDCLIHHIGRTEKQSAGVQISMSDSIKVSHCSIYHVPRSGINLSEGTFGGHCIEYCDVFDTVRETGDHGCINAWGRDRWWCLEDADDSLMKKLCLKDALHPVVIRNNRLRCDRGWDIDLDDGASNYKIYNNLCLNGGIKLREGFLRTVYHNIMINNTLHQHLWFENCGDEIYENIMTAPYLPRRMPDFWEGLQDRNILHTAEILQPLPAKPLCAISGKDEHSILCNCRFAEPETGDYTVTNPDVCGTYFQNFSMKDFGVLSPSLAKKAETPPLPVLKPYSPEEEGKIRSFGHLQLKDVETEGEMSAYGTPGITGIIVKSLPPHSPEFVKGFRPDDVIVMVDGVQVKNFEELLKIASRHQNLSQPRVTVIQNQKYVELA